MSLYKSSNLSYTELVAFLKLGYQLRDKMWDNVDMHIELNMRIDPAIEVHTERGRVPLPDTQKVIAVVDDWQIYKIGTLDAKEAIRLSALGLQVGRQAYVNKFDWLNRIGNGDAGYHDMTKLTPDDLNATDWFVPLTEANQKILDIEITDAMIAVYEEYKISLNKDTFNGNTLAPKVSQSTPIDSKSVNLLGYALPVNTPGCQPFTKYPDATVETILADNRLHRANLKTMQISLDIIDRMLKHMGEKNITIDELAAHMNINKEALLDTIRCPNNLSIRQLVDIADAIDFDLATIFK